MNQNIYGSSASWPSKEEEEVLAGISLKSHQAELIVRHKMLWPHYKLSTVLQIADKINWKIMRQKSLQFLHTPELQRLKAKSESFLTDLHLSSSRHIKAISKAAFKTKGKNIRLSVQTRFREKPSCLHLQPGGLQWLSFVSCPKRIIRQHQHIQGASARVLTGTRRIQLITPCSLI